MDQAQGDILNPPGHDTSGAGLSTAQARRNSLSRDADLEANASREKVLPERSFISTTKGKITVVVAAIVVIAAVVGGVVG
ncbi:hypothetical protein FIBSPDRAFT_1039863 [Athelia psychrophila]|uniref:Uncharacterized protein n=1 Tax=Athelia psychrophila TaxID=1759441 RepID=A0A166R3I8_9AGAM|nr:hypothetical protein FIBSPDRAFT_1039863 [Fibularhizoctonia sp. CBS 109695]